MADSPGALRYSDGEVPPFRAPAEPPEQRVGSCNLLVVVLLILGAVLLVGLLLPAVSAAIRNSHTTACVSNLAQLWKMQHNYQVTHGGIDRSMPAETGGAFWMKLTTVTPPLLDDSLVSIFACPVKSDPPAAGTTDYRGPRHDVRTLLDGDAVGGDRIGNHGSFEGGNVLRKSGDVQSVAESDPLWMNASATTKP